MVVKHKLGSSGHAVLTELPKFPGLHRRGKHINLNEEGVREEGSKTHFLSTGCILNYLVLSAFTF